MINIKTNSLRWQIVSRFFLILLILLVGMEVFQYETMKEYLYQSKEQILDARFHNMRSTENISTSKEVINSAKDIINMTIDYNMSAAIVDVNGSIIASSIKTPDTNKTPNDDSIKENAIRNNKKNQPQISIVKLSPKEYKKLLNQPGTLEGYRLVNDKNNNLQIVGFRKIGNLSSPVGLIELCIPAASVQDILSRQVYIYIFATSLILVIGTIVGGIVFKYTLKPLYHMASEVEKINVEQLDKRLTLENKQLEIDTLAKAFNNMMEKIEVSFKQEQLIKDRMRQFVSDASHELRTPLTSIHGFVEVLLRGAAKSEEQLNSALNSILLESERLTKLVNDLLLLTRFDQHTPQEMSTENIKAIIEEIFPQLKILVAERTIELKLKDNILILANKNQIKQVIYNLVQNAVRHTDAASGTIIISADYENENKMQNKFVVLKITDNGTGISKEHLNKIFDRFFRSEEHRSRKYGGYGLGLSIVKAIVDAHGGKIEVESEVGRGTTFSIYLKLKNV